MISAITDIPASTNKQELMKLLGMATYLMKFVPKFSQETSILRNLLKKDTNWLWDSHHHAAFFEPLQQSVTVQFFDQNKPIVLSVDESSLNWWSPSEPPARCFIHLLFFLETSNKVFSN